MGNSGWNCLENKSNISVNGNSVLLSTVSTTTDHNNLLNANTLTKSTPSTHSITFDKKNSYNIVSSNSSATVYNYKYKGPIIIKLQSKKQLTKQFI